MTNLFDSNEHRNGRSVVSPSMKAAISSAILAEPGLETSEVRVSVSAGYVVLEGYVYERDHIDKVVSIAWVDRRAGTGQELRFPSKLAGGFLEPSHPQSPCFKQKQRRRCRFCASELRSGVELYIDQAKFRDQFAHDVPVAEAALMAAGQRAVTQAALTEKSEEAAFKTLPSHFIYGDGDKNIPAKALGFMAAERGFEAYGRRQRGVGRRHGLAS